MAQGSSARRPVGYQVAYLRTRILGSNGAGTYSIGWIPAGSNILRVSSSTRVVLDGAPTMTIGSSAAPDGLVADGAAGLTALGNTSQDVAAGVGSIPDIDTEIVVVIGGAPTDGISDVQVEFIPPDEVQT